MVSSIPNPAYSAAFNASFERGENTDFPGITTQWWVIQALYWLILAWITFFTLTMWYSPIHWPYIAHTILQSIMGFAISLPLQRLCNATNSWDLRPKAAAVTAAMLLSATLWSVLRVSTFEEITGNTGVWSDFGGWFFGAITVFLGWTGLYYTFHYYRLLQRERQRSLIAAARSANAELAAREAQLKMLQYQLNPHFLFNTLNAVNGLIATGQGDQSQAMIAKLSDFMRYSLDTQATSLTSLATELERTEIYLDLEKVRFEDRLNVIMEIAEQAQELQVPSFLLQPLIENSIKFAIANSESGGTIEIYASVDRNQLTLSVIDSGAANCNQKQPPQASAGRGIGINNLRERLALHFGNKASLRAANESYGYMVKVFMPANMAAHGVTAATARQSVAADQVSPITASTVPESS